MRPLSLVAACVLALPAFAQEPGKDALGDPLPEGAVARLGTERLRGERDGEVWVHPDGKRLIAVVRGWPTAFDIATGKSLGTIGEPALQTIVGFSGDGKLVVSRIGSVFSTTGRKVVVWDITTGKAVHTQDEKDLAYPQQIALSADGKTLAVVGEPNPKSPAGGVPIRVRAVGGNADLVVLKAEFPIVRAFALSADGKRGVVLGGLSAEEKKANAGATDKLQVWDVAKGEPVATAFAKSGQFSRIAISPAGDRVALGFGFGCLNVFDATTGRLMHELFGQKAHTGDLRFSPDGKTVACVGADGVVLRWDVVAGETLPTTACPVQGGEAPHPKAVTFVGPDRLVAAGRFGCALVAWEAPSGKRLSPAGGHLHPVSAVAFASDEVVSATHLEGVFRWTTTGTRLDPEGKPLLAFTRPPDSRSHLQYAPNGHFALHQQPESADIFDLTTGEPRVHLPEPRHRVLPGMPFGNPISVNADGTCLVLATGQGSRENPQPAGLLALDPRTGRKRYEMPLPKNTEDVQAVAVSPNGKRAAVTRLAEGEKRVSAITTVDLSTGKVTGETLFTDQHFRPRLVGTPDGQSVLATVPGEPGLHLFDLETGTKGSEFGKFRPLDQGRYVNPIAVNPLFSPDGKRVAVAIHTGGVPKIQVCEWPSAKVTHTFRGHVAEVTCLAFSKDGKRLASGSLDTTVLLWDVSKE